MKKAGLGIVLVVLVLLVWGRLHHREAVSGDSPYKIYVAMGFHSNFYHSWRGDTPDEAGFGTDIRFARGILDALDEAEAQGLDARGYWDTDVYFTLQKILPEHAPDIIERIRIRVEAGKDEVLLAPFNNGILSAMTEEELRKAIRWSISNPWGSGLKDLFGAYTPLLRPNEAMFTPGAEKILKEEGVEGVLLAYSGYPFTSYSNFIKPLPPEQRYNPLWLRTTPNGEKIIWFPTVSIGDVLNHQSLENWMLELRKLQVSGEVQRDMIIHINFDTDSEAWIPPKMPWFLQWFPNSGGVREYIRYVNKYDWAKFTTPGEYLESHPPQEEVYATQDTADGSFDGHYSWAEKFTSHETWSKVEKARLIRKRSRSISESFGIPYRKRNQRVIENQDALLVLSTTHFGMSTPMLNEERQAAAKLMADRNLQREQGQLKQIARKIKNNRASRNASDEWRFMIQSLEKGNATHWMRVPVLLPQGRWPGELKTMKNELVKFSFINTQRIPGNKIFGELMFKWSDSDFPRFTLNLTDKQLDWQEHAAPEFIKNENLSILLDEVNGIRSLSNRSADKMVFDGRPFLAPFIHYNNQLGSAEKFTITVPAGEIHEGLQRVRLEASIPVEAKEGKKWANLKINLTLPDKSLGVIADVEIEYPYTEKTEVLATAQQRLRRLFDFTWTEVAPFQIYPAVKGDRNQPVKIWKHNYLGVTSSYELNHAAINLENGELDAVNNHVTAGWVAVTDRINGLMIANNADVRHSYAFAPMRVREEKGQQVLSINPFGSYHGRQLDYSHMGGTDLGYKMNLVAGSHIRPNGPSYNGQRERFSLFLAPYKGDVPPQMLQDVAQNFFYPPAVVYLSAPGFPLAVVPDDVYKEVESKMATTLVMNNDPLEVPAAFLASPSVQAIDLVWDIPRDSRVTATEINWKKKRDSEWRGLIVENDRARIDELEDDEKYVVRVRALGELGESAWSAEREVTAGAAQELGITSGVDGLTLGLMLETFYYGLVHALTSP